MHAPGKYHPRNVPERANLTWQEGHAKWVAHPLLHDEREANKDEARRCHQDAHRVDACAEDGRRLAQRAANAWLRRPRRAGSWG
eukprot:1144253-Prymnesium_polylepis.1